MLGFNDHVAAGTYHSCGVQIGVADGSRYSVGNSDMMKLFQPEEVIFRPGDLSECAYLIETGQVEVLEGDPARPVRIALLGKGDIVGETALIDEQPRLHTARAVGAASLSTVTREQFVRLMFHDPAEGLRYLRAFFERLRTMNARVARLDSPGVAQTMALRPAIKIRLVPLTVMSELVLPAAGLVIERFPFRVGREPFKGKSRLSMNDLGLPDEEPFNVSRGTLPLTARATRWSSTVRGSFLGTIVNGGQIGGRRTAGSAPLHAGPTKIIAGSQASPFRFSVSRGARTERDRSSPTAGIVGISRGRGQGQSTTWSGT